MNLIGHLSGNFGLAVAARNTAQMLAHNATPLSIINLDPGHDRGGETIPYPQFLQADDRPAPFGVNLLHTNPPNIVELRKSQDPPWLDIRNRANACVPFWELPLLPPGTWPAVLEAMDLVLCPTTFVLQAVKYSAPRANALHYLQAALLPDTVRPNRVAWGLRDGRTCLLLMFDITSDLDRKNPSGAIDAFRRAFGHRDDVDLVIRVNNLNHPGFEDQRIRLAKMLEGLETVTVIDRALSHAEVLSLVASCDAMVSLHRSEGLGLHLLEAMALGKPVVATGWSGNMDFTTEENSFLVPYDLVGVTSSHPAYQPSVIGSGQYWAEPRIQEAADLMERLVDEPEARSAVGSRARKDMEEARRRFLSGEAIGQLRQAWANLSDRETHRDRAQRFEAAAPGNPALRFRRRVVRALRATGFRR